MAHLAVDVYSSDHNCSVKLIKDLFVFYSLSNGKYIDDTKYSNMHTVSSLDEPKYASCHIEDQAMKQQFSTANLATVGGCHPDDVTDSSMAVIKSEDNTISNSYILPQYLH